MDDTFCSLSFSIVEINFLLTKRNASRDLYTTLWLMECLNTGFNWNFVAPQKLRMPNTARMHMKNVLSDRICRCHHFGLMLLVKYFYHHQGFLTRGLNFRFVSTFSGLNFFGVASCMYQISLLWFSNNWIIPYISDLSPFLCYVLHAFHDYVLLVWK